MVRLGALTLVLTLGGVVLGLPRLSAVVAMPIALDHMGSGARPAGGGSAALAAAAAGDADRAVRDLSHGTFARHAVARWLSPGALLASALWLLASMVFSIYVESFATYSRTFGSLGAVAVLLMWLYVGAYVVLLGAELDAETERQRRLR